MRKPVKKYVAKNPIRDSDQPAGVCNQELVQKDKNVQVEKEDLHENKDVVPIVSCQILDPNPLVGFVHDANGVDDEISNISVNLVVILEPAQVALEQTLQCQASSVIWQPSEEPRVDIILENCVRALHPLGLASPDSFNCQNNTISSPSNEVVSDSLQGNESTFN